MRSIQQILETSHVIAVVGASRDASKAAHQIPLALQRMGYRVIPVNPLADEIFGEKAYPTLRDVPEHIDVVNVFRPSEQTPEAARAAVAASATTLWLQLDIRSDESRTIAETAGLDYVEDACLMVEARRFGIDKSRPPQ